MKIVVLSHRVPYPPIKGEKIRTYHQLEALREAGCDVTLFCPMHEPEDEALVAEYASKTSFKVIASHSGRSSLRMLRNLFTGQSLSVAKFHFRELQNKLNSHLAEHEADVLYCTSSAMAEYALIADNRNSRCKVLVDFMDLDSDKWQRFSEVSKLPMSFIYRYEARVLGRYEKKVQRLVDHCVFVSQAEADLFCTKHNSFGENLEVIGNGVDLSDFYPPASTEHSQSPTLLFTGVMDYLPNESAICWFAENVWEQIVEKYPDARLIVAGMKPTQRVLDLEHYKNVKVTGYVDDMLPYYHQADVFIAPFQIARGVQNKILQAFACGLPVVTTPLGAEGIDGEGDVHFLIADSPDHFAQRIEELVNEPEKYKQLSESASRLINEEYRWEAKNRPLVDLILSNS